MAEQQAQHKGAYDFDPAEEPPDVRIEILPRRYVSVNGQVYALEKSFELDSHTGQKKLVWDTTRAQVDVPRRIADMLIVSSHPKRSAMAKVVGTVTSKTAEDSSEEETTESGGKRRRKPSEE